MLTNNEWKVTFEKLQLCTSSFNRGMLKHLSVKFDNAAQLNQML